jgi:hypothetical protein
MFNRPNHEEDAIYPATTKSRDSERNQANK